ATAVIPAARTRFARRSARRARRLDKGRRRNPADPGSPRYLDQYSVPLHASARDWVATVHVADGSVAFRHPFALRCKRSRSGAPKSRPKRNGNAVEETTPNKVPLRIATRRARPLNRAGAKDRR